MLRKMRQYWGCLVDIMAPMGALGPPDVQVAIKLFLKATQTRTGSHKIVYKSHSDRDFMIS